ncbi:MAG: M23 family metallopeptidase [Verrucomicrobiota bacterium]|nr:M23 family metallopeptidase [Verrucomicrobiota bacterium]
MKRGVLLLLTLWVVGLRAESLELAWPTPNRAWLEGRPIRDFIQPTESGEPESGCFGCVRSNGYQFHEGIDIKPVRRDSRGEPLDDVFAALPGVVRYVNLRPGESSYGRYIVLEHPSVTPAIYTLYAHLASVAPGIAPGAQVQRSQVIARMGHSAGGYAIPLARAHLHFEMGVMVTRDFQSWYDWKKFRSPNEHGIWNGMNLMGFDPLDFLRKFRARQVSGFQDYFSKMQPAVRVRIATKTVPDFVARYPSLLTRPLPPGSAVAGWEITCNWTGLPFAWTPLTPAEVAGLASNQPMIAWADFDLQRYHHCKSIVRVRGSGYVPGTDLGIVLQQLFGLRD